MIQLFRKLAAGLALLAPLASATAGTVGGTGSVTLSTTVTQLCHVAATSTLTFVNYDPVGANASAPLSGTGSITIKCTKGILGSGIVSIDLDGGLHASGGQRRLQGNTVTTEFLNYSVTQPSTASPWTTCGSTVWGSTVGGSVYMPAGVTWGVTTPPSFTVCGSVDAGQNPLIQNYSDTITVTVNF